MQSLNAARGGLPSQTYHEASTITLIAAAICLVWYIAVAFVCSVGYVQIFRYYSHPSAPAKVADKDDASDVTVIRPIKGLEPSLYDCLASTFRQVYPKRRLHVRLCVPSRSDPAFPVLERLLRDFPEFDVKVLVENEDDSPRGASHKLGPNPKIRNMSRAYREAGADDVVWIVDCNVWIAKHTCARMVQTLQGNKFVHQLPLVVDTIGTTQATETHGMLSNASHAQARTTSAEGKNAVTIPDDKRTWSTIGGGRLEEAFMSSSHAKFYTAINTVLIAPCIVGKSTMFRKSHLNSLTNDQGIDYFSQNICEDHLIGDLLWKQQVPEQRQGHRLGKHAMCFGDLAIQPMSNMSVSEYWNRRVRWLRVRKFTVTLATLVEPGTESFLCSAYGAFAVTMLPSFDNTLRAVGLGQNWRTGLLFWLLSVSIWCAMDWSLYIKLHSAASVHVDESTPEFARQPKNGNRRPFAEWMVAWLGRETLALPIWLWAFWGGTTVEWRGKKFWVGMDMKVHELDDRHAHMNGGAKVMNGKMRFD